MKDFSHWKEYEGASEGSGRSEKQWLINPDTNQTGLFKYKKDVDTTDHASECIASDLANLIQVPCAHFEIGMFHGKEGSFSYNIIDRESIILIEGIYCISMLYHSFDIDKLVNIQSGERYSLKMIQMALEPFHLFEEFLPILVFDFLIGNTDRHQSNWALIMENKQYKLSPLYDNSSSLCAYVPESKIDRYLGNDHMLWNSLIDTKSRSLIRIDSYDDRQPTHTEMLRFLRNNYYEQTAHIVNKIDRFVTCDRIYAILEKYNEVLSEKKKMLILRYLVAKKEIMRDIYRKRS